jgi:hypothetical protein
MRSPLERNEIRAEGEGEEEAEEDHKESNMKKENAESSLFEKILRKWESALSLLKSCSFDVIISSIQIRWEEILQCDFIENIESKYSPQIILYHHFLDCVQDEL